MDSKVCVTCHIDQPLSEYNKRARAKDGLQARCRRCSSQWYIANRNAHIENTRARTDRTRRRLYQLLRRFLQNNPCFDCGESDVRTLQFDHVDPASKSWAVAVMVRRARPWEVILTEIEKCEVRCANCHSRRTAEMGGSWRQAAWLEDETAMAGEARARLETVL
ncbi:MAG TPA: hypothetical protein VFD41_06735, partial [Actinomycetales bacterium]|nr:hypothetical protein [Actinomycetales bacterium]